MKKLIALILCISLSTLLLVGCDGGIDGTYVHTCDSCTVSLTLDSNNSSSGTHTMSIEDADGSLTVLSGYYYINESDKGFVLSNITLTFIGGERDGVALTNAELDAYYDMYDAVSFSRADGYIEIDSIRFFG